MGVDDLKQVVALCPAAFSKRSESAALTLTPAAFTLSMNCCIRLSLRCWSTNTSSTLAGAVLTRADTA